MGDGGVPCPSPVVHCGDDITGVMICVRDSSIGDIFSTLQALCCPYKHTYGVNRWHTYNPLIPFSPYAPSRGPA